VKDCRQHGFDPPVARKTACPSSRVPAQTNMGTGASNRWPSLPTIRGYHAKLYEALADAFLAEGVDTQFVPDGRRQHALVHRVRQTAGRAVRPCQARARDVAAATAYNVATGKLAVASSPAALA